MYYYGTPFTLSFLDHKRERTTHNVKTLAACRILLDTDKKYHGWTRLVITYRGRVIWDKDRK